MEENKEPKIESVEPKIEPPLKCYLLAFQIQEEGFMGHSGSGVFKLCPKKNNHFHRSYYEKRIIDYCGYHPQSQVRIESIARLDEDFVKGWDS